MERVLIRGLFKSNQTRYAVDVEGKTKRIFGIACLGKKFLGLFHRVKELSKSNQTRYGVSPGYVEGKTKRIFAIACLGKKLVLHTEICEFRK